MVKAGKKIRYTEAEMNHGIALHEAQKKAEAAGKAAPKAKDLDFKGPANKEWRKLLEAHPELAQVTMSCDGHLRAVAKGQP
jgi:hypothetical protein